MVGAVGIVGRWWRKENLGEGSMHPHAYSQYAPTACPPRTFACTKTINNPLIYYSKIVIALKGGHDLVLVYQAGSERCMRC